MAAPGTKALGVRIDAGIHARAKRAAAERGTTLSAWVEHWVDFGAAHDVDEKPVAPASTDTAVDA